MEKKLILLLWLVLASGCAPFKPPVDPPTEYLERVEWQSSGNVRVGATVLSAEEADAVFATRLTKKKIQPVWVEIENRDDSDLLLMALSMDPSYFAPSEAAWISRRFGERRSEDKMRYFSDMQIPLFIPANTTVSGFVYTNLDPGVKAFTVELIGDQVSHDFEYIMLVPGFQADFMMRIQPGGVYGPEEIRELDLDGLREYIETLPCCLLGGDQETPGDPLNLVIVGDGADTIAGFVRRGWDITETNRLGTAWRTFWSSVFKNAYRTSPVSSLYMFERPQDIALQKSRGSINERNHLRVWVAPVSVQGQSVFVGQISRDIGLRLSKKTLVTHKIDPDVDEARMYLLLDMLASRHLKSAGFVTGVGVSTPDSPARNYTRDPYFTDGLRLVLFTSDEEHTLDDIDWLQWERPPGLGGSLKDSAEH